MSSPDLRRQDVGYAVDAYTRRENNGSPTAVHSVRKNIPSSTMTANSGPSSSTEVNDHVSSVRNSPRNISDDDTGTNRGPVHRTLPGRNLLQFFFGFLINFSRTFVITNCFSCYDNILALFPLLFM